MSLTQAPVFLWFAAFVAAAWCVPRRWQPWCMAATSVLFLGSVAPGSLLALAGIVLVSFFAVDCDSCSRLRVLAAITVCLVIFVLLRTGLKAQLAGPNGPVALGLAYYTLRSIHYLVDRWQGRIGRHSFGDYVAYQFFLPTLMAGPINRFQEFQRGLNRRHWDAAAASAGLERILYGYAKVVILGNYLVSNKLMHVIDRKLAPDTLFAVYLDCFRYGANLYFQFSGYSDVAIGLALLCGIRIAENFRAPFLAVNINDFWQRWHISLSSWCREYVHIPALALTRQPLLAIATTMLFLGFWHEFSLRYLAWGGYHALGIMVWHKWQEVRPRSLAAGPVARGAAWFLTANFVLLSFLITKERDLAATMHLLRSLLPEG